MGKSCLPVNAVREAFHKGQACTTSLSFYIFSIWLFTLSDIKTIILPSLLFAVFTAPALNTVFGFESPMHTLEILGRVHLVVFWLWINLLPFTINNQSHPESIIEDAINKPWRTLPSGRMTPTRARGLMFFFYAAAVISSVRLGGLSQNLSLIVLGYWYNDLRGADTNFVVRQFINAAGFNRFTTGALDVLLAAGETPTLTTKHMLHWQWIIGCIVLSTIQIQDLPDQDGDSRRGRRTMPLVIGDKWCRYSVSAFVPFWSLFCPAYIGGSSVAIYAMPVGLGAIVAARSSLLRRVLADKRTFQLWNLWLVSIYSLPLVKMWSQVHWGGAVD